MRTADPTSSRACLPLEQWPESDQQLWKKACSPASPFDEAGGQLAAMSPATREKYFKGNGRWLQFLTTMSPHSLALSPFERCTKENLKAYIGFLLGHGNSGYTIVGRLMELSAVLKAFDPNFDRSLLKRYIAVNNGKVKPVRDRSHIPPSGTLLDLGFKLMKQAEDPREYADALAYRDGLIISYLALHPVRLRNLENFHVGTNLVRSEAGYLVTFAGSETKNGSPLEFSLAVELVKPMDEYLKSWRPALIARNTRKSRMVGSSVWVSSVGSPLGATTIYHSIRLRTRNAFGRSVNPHSFRNAAATTVAIATPSRIRSAAALLGHRSFATTEKHYIEATGLEAHRDLAVVLKVYKKGGRSD